MASSARDPSDPFWDFNARAPIYDESQGGTINDTARALLDDFSPPITASSVVLDNACGTGIATAEILAHCQATATAAPRIHAVDLHPKMLDVMRDTTLAGFPASSRDRVTVEAMNGQALSFPAETFSHSITCFGIFFFEDADQGLREIVRTLRPGGQAVLTSWASVSWIKYVMSALNEIRPGQPPQPLPLDRRWAESEWMQQQLAGAGLRDVAVRALPVYNRQTDLDAFIDGTWDMTSPFRKGWSADEVARWRPSMLKAFQTMGTDKDEDGRVVFESVALIAHGRKE